MGMVLAMSFSIVSFKVGINTPDGQSLTKWSSITSAIFLMPGLVLASPTWIAQRKQRRLLKQIYRLRIRDVATTPSSFGQLSNEPSTEEHLNPPDEVGTEPERTS